MLSLEMMKHLFHGTSKIDPSLIYAFEAGLDSRKSNNGANGSGIYFSDNSNYSNTFSWENPEGHFQMFLCLVLIGVSSQ